MSIFSSERFVTPTAGIVYANSQPMTPTRRVANVRVIKPRCSKALPKRCNELPAVCGVRDLAAYLGVGKNTAYALVKSDQIQAVRVGRQYRMRREAVLDFLNSKK